MREWRQRVEDRGQVPLDRLQGTGDGRDGSGTDTEGQKTGDGGHGDAEQRIWEHVDRGQRTGDGPGYRGRHETGQRTDRTM